MSRGRGVWRDRHGATQALPAGVAQGGPRGPCRCMAPDPASTSLTPNSNEARTAQQARDWAVLEERLAFAASRAAGQIEGIFGPDSMSWRLLRESVGLASGASALMLQLAHPAVAAGVSQHSTLQRNPLGRARRTFYLMYQLVLAIRTQPWVPHGACTTCTNA